jgi:hypothetical protein
VDSIQRIAELNKQKQDALNDKVKHEESQIALIQLQETVVKSFNTLVDYLDNKVTRTQVVNQLREIGTPDAMKVVEAVNQLHTTLKTHENTDLSEITGVMREVLSEAKKIPKELPKQQDIKIADYSKDFSNLTNAIKAVEKVVKEQKLIAEAPIVNIDPKIEVQPPDLKPLQDAIGDVVKSIEAIVIPEYKTDNKAVEDLIKKSNKLLKELVEKPVSAGGGGGGRATPYQDSNGTPAFVELTPDGKIPVDTSPSTYESRNDTTTDTNLVYLGKALPGSDVTDAAWQIKRYNKSAGTMTFADDVTTFTKVWNDRTTYGY